MKKKKNIQWIGIILVFLVVIALVWYFVDSRMPDARKELGFTFEIRDTDAPRINLEKNPVLPYHFGFFPPGRSFGRSINVTNPEPETMRINAYSIGDATEWVNLTFPEAIDANSSAEGYVRIKIPDNAEFRNYSTTIRVDFFKKD